LALTAFIGSGPNFWLGSGRSEFFFAVAAYTVLVALTLSPLLFTSVPPLVDYPDHLARMWILVHGSENYQANWHLLPALAMDLIVPPLAHFMRSRRPEGCSLG
jgi:hypothetical protein